MVKCKSCGKEVSEKAESCPHCGHPVKRKPVGCLGAIGIVGAVFVIAVLITTSNDEPGSAQESPKAQVAVDCTIQADRKAFIQDMVDKGYWEKVAQPATLYHVHVMPAFMREATFTEKQTFISTVAAYDICEGGDGLVVIVDAMTGKDIGTFSAGRLSLD